MHQFTFFSYLLIGLLCTTTAKAAVDIYQSANATLAIEKSADTITATLSGGSTADGAGAQADCVVKYQLTATSANQFQAKMLPFTTELMAVDEQMIADNAASLTQDHHQILVIADVFGICPLGSSFDGEYDKLDPQSKRYQQEFAWLFKQNQYHAQALIRQGKAQLAQQMLQPYLHPAKQLAAADAE